jgi:hypothetical protein
MNPQPHAPNPQPPAGGLSSKQLTKILVAVISVFGLLALCGIVASVNSFLNPPKPGTSADASPPVQTTPAAAPVTPSPQASPTPTQEEVGSDKERLAVAAEIRHYLRDQDIPAYVVASGSELRVYYRVAQIEYAPDTFFKQQGKAGMERIANAGFETVVIEAQDPNGGTQKKEFSVSQYRSK